MTDVTDASDREALTYIGRNPGCKRRNGRGQASPRINNAAATRLVNAGLVKPPNSSGKLYLTDAGRAALAEVKLTTVTRDDISGLRNDALLVGDEPVRLLCIAALRARNDARAQVEAVIVKGRRASQETGETSG